MEKWLGLLVTTAVKIQWTVYSNNLESEPHWNLTVHYLWQALCGLSLHFDWIWTRAILCGRHNSSHFSMDNISFVTSNYFDQFWMVNWPSQNPMVLNSPTRWTWTHPSKIQWIGLTYLPLTRSKCKWSYDIEMHIHSQSMSTQQSSYNLRSINSEIVLSVITIFPRVFSSFVELIDE